MESLKDKIIKGEDEDEQEAQGAGALPSTSPMAKLEVEGGGGGGGGVDLADEVPDRGVPSLALLTDELGGDRDRDRLD